MSTNSNAFWREVLDFLPGLTFLFRIDEQELAHLIFASDGIRPELGFSPEEYVLASEEPGSVVNGDLEKLVDKIAGYSHDGGGDETYTCELTDRNGTLHSFVFDFRLFRTKASRNNMISVSLHPAGSVPEKGADAAGQQASGLGELFVLESPLMQEVMERIETLSRQSHPVLIRGEVSVGKSAIASRLARKSAILNGNQQVWELDLRSWQPSPDNPRLFAGLDPENPSESLLDDIDKDLQLVIVEIGKMSLADQKDLLQLIANRNTSGKATRIIATSAHPVETLMEKGVLDPSLVYKLPFFSVFVPPLRDRREDVRALADAYIPRLSELLQLDTSGLGSKIHPELEKHPLKGNFVELYSILRETVITGRDSLSGVVHPGVAESGGSRPGAEGAFFSSKTLVSFDALTKAYLQTVLKHTDGKIYGPDGAAALLKLRPTTLQSKLKKLNIR